MRLIDLDEVDFTAVYERDEVYYRNTFESGVRSTLSFLNKQPTIEAAEPLTRQCKKLKCYAICDGNCKHCGVAKEEDDG